MTQTDIEKRARELFAEENLDGLTWDLSFMVRDMIRQDRGTAAIGEDLRQQYLDRAKRELESDGRHDVH